MIRIAIASLLLVLSAIFATLISTQNRGWVSSVSPVSIAAVSGEVITANTASTGSPSFPQLTGRVVDQAGLLDISQRSSLTARLAEFEGRSSDQVVVATIPSLGGENLEDYANRLFRHWQLGQADEDNGVLLLIARDDRKIRIEVGYGLEGILTDAISKTIIDLVIVPQFRAGNFGAGIVQGTDLIVQVLSGDTAELEARKNRNTSSDDFGWPQFLFVALWFTLFFGSIGFSILAPIYGKKLGKGRYKWLGIEVTMGSSSGSTSSGWSSGSSSGGFSGGGGSSGGGGASGGW